MKACRESMAYHVGSAHYVQGPQPVETVLRCLVPAAEIGQVIGPKGKTVQSMRDRSGATIKVHEGNSGAATSYSKEAL